MAQERAELLVALRDELSTKLSKIDQRIGGLTKTVASGEQTRTAYADSLKKIGSQAMAAAGLTIGLTGAVMGLRKAWDYAMEGLKANRIEAAFTQAAGGAEAATAALERMRSASGGALDDTSLQTFTNRAVRMGFEVEDAYSIMTLARQEAIKTGESELALGQQLLQATATGRAQSLQAVGILIDNVAAEREHAVTLRKTREELTELEKIQGRRAKTLARIKDLGAIADGATSNLEGARSAWDNFISGIQQGWERALDPIAAAQREGAAMVAQFDPMTASAVEEVQRTTAALQEAQEALTRARTAAADPWAKAGGSEMFAEIEARAEAAEAKVAGLQSGLSTQAVRLVGVLNSLGVDAANTLETTRSVLEKGLTPEQLEANREVLEDYVDQLDRLKVVAQAFQGPMGDVLKRILGDQEGLLEDEIANLQVREEELLFARRASLDWYRTAGRELEALKARGATLTTAEVARLNLLEQVTKAYAGQHTEILKVAGTVEDLRGLSAKLLPDADVGAQARLDEAHRRLQEAQGAITAALKSGDLDNARVALVSYRASADAVASSLRAAGVAQEALNAYLQDAGTQASYAQKRIDNYQRSVSEKVINDLLAGAGELLKRGVSSEAVQTILGTIKDTYDTVLLMGIKARKVALEELERLAKDAAKVPTVKPPPPKPADVTAWDAEELRILEENLQGRERIIAEHHLRISQLIGEYEAGRITLDKYGMEADKLRAVKRADIMELDVQAQADALAQERELQLERLRQEQLRGNLTDLELKRRELDLDVTMGYMDAELAAEKRLTLGIEEELAKRAELYRRLEDGVTQATDGITSALQGYQALSSTMAQDDQLDQRFMQRAQLLNTAGASALRSIVVATKGSAAETGSAMSSLITDVGMAVASFDKDAKRAALTMALFSLASAAIAVATKQYEKAAGFLAAAGMYGAIAGGAGARRHHAPRAERPSIATSAGTTQSGGSGGINLTVVYNSGMALATREELGVEIINAANAAAYSMAKLNPAVVGAGR